MQNRYAQPYQQNYNQYPIGYGQYNPGHEQFNMNMYPQHNYYYHQQPVPYQPAQYNNQNINYQNYSPKPLDYGFVYDNQDYPVDDSNEEKWKHFQTILNELRTIPPQNQQPQQSPQLQQQQQQQQMVRGQQANYAQPSPPLQQQQANNLGSSTPNLNTNQSVSDTLIPPKAQSQPLQLQPKVKPQPKKELQLKIKLNRFGKQGQQGSDLLNSFKNEINKLPIILNDFMKNEYVNGLLNELKRKT